MHRSEGNPLGVASRLVRPSEGNSTDPLGDRRTLWPQRKSDSLLVSFNSEVKQVMEIPDLYHWPERHSYPTCSGLSPWETSSLVLNQLIVLFFWVFLESLGFFDLFSPFLCPFA